MYVLALMATEWHNVWVLVFIGTLEAQWSMLELAGQEFDN